MSEETGISNLGGYAISIGVAIIIIVIMAILIQSIRDDTGITPDSTASHPNETLTWGGNNTAIGLMESRINTGSLILYNNGSKVNKGDNYTVTEYSITIINSSPGGTNVSNGRWGAGQGELTTNKLNVTYDYKFGSGARNVTDKGLESQNTFSSFLPIVAITLVGALIIGIVLRYYGRKREGID